MSVRVITVPAADLEAWVKLGWRDAGEAAMGNRGEGPQRRIEWSGDGEPPIPGAPCCYAQDRGYPFHSPDCEAE